LAVLPLPLKERKLPSYLRHRRLRVVTGETD